jgi:prephenate dehydratase
MTTCAYLSEPGNADRYGLEIAPAAIQDAGGNLTRDH